MLQSLNNWIHLDIILMSIHLRYRLITSHFLTHTHCHNNLLIDLFPCGWAFLAPVCGWCLLIGATDSIFRFLMDTAQVHRGRHHLLLRFSLSRGRLTISGWPIWLLIPSIRETWVFAGQQLFNLYIDSSRRDDWDNQLRLIVLWGTLDNLGMQGWLSWK
jgi:hypothetical protein